MDDIKENGLPFLAEVHFLFGELFPAEVGFMAGVGEFFGEAQAGQLRYDGIVGRGGLFVAAKFFVAFCDGPGGVQPVWFQFPGTVPVREGFVVTLHGVQQVSGVDVQCGTFGEAGIGQFCPAPCGSVVLSEDVRLDQTDPILELRTVALYKGEKFVDVFLITADFPEKIALLAAGGPVGVGIGCGAGLDDTVEKFPGFAHADEHHILVEDQEQS